MSEGVKKLNCWEFQQCGREPGGDNVSSCGVCPASDQTLLDGIHGGKNAGRACWAVAGTMCEGETIGSNAKKKSCTMCEFYEVVRQEEGSDGFVPTFALLQKLPEKDQAFF
ncbi:MAG: hypothetical protein JSV21_04370 [Nitrospirota bacterium]|nr:MAG: hypothetical protein JSV21_04370 [Nitrospirota bacterium]